MKSPLTKLTAAAVMIIAALPLVLFFTRGATPVYAFEQTIEANHTIKTIHLRIFEGAESIENNEFEEYWLKYNDAGKLANLRCNKHDEDGVCFTVWNEGVAKSWMPKNNVVIIIRLNNTDKEWEDFVEEFDPKFSTQWLYDQSKEKEALDIQIDEPVEDSNSIYVKATSSVHKVRVELVVDRKTKLIKKLLKYHLRENGDELDLRVEFLAYNQPIDPSMFELSDISDDAKVYDQVDRLVGLEKGDLTNKEIAAKVVREGLEATIAKDYDEVSRLMEGDPGDTIEEFIEREFEARLVRIVSIGQPETHEKTEFFVYVPCEIEVENEERGRWIVNIIATSKAIEYQDDRWIMHTDLRVSGPYILSTSTLNEQDRIEGNIIVPGLSVGDYTFGMSKDEVLRKLGEPKSIHFGGEDYTLDNLPRRYYMIFDDISFDIDDDSVKGIGVHSPHYKFTNGLGMGDSEQQITQAFGNDFHLEEGKGTDFLTYEDQGLHFEIHKQDRTVMEINVTQKISRRNESASVKPIQSIKPFDDVRAKDLSKYDLSSQKGLIAKLQFNRETVWPERAKMPPGSDPEKILMNAMNPGLGVRELHQQGITGKGINVAIIDQPLFKDHPEYDGKIAAYFDTGCETDESSMHGPAVASLLVGTNCGTAPEARVYYAAAPSWKADAAYYAKALEWIMVQNEKLPKGKKIRVVSVSAAPSGPGSPFKKNREKWDQACARAEADGIMMLDCTNSHRGFINRGWYNPEDPESVIKFNLGPPPKRELKIDLTEMSLYVPSSCRTTAEHGDDRRNSYIYWGRGGLSWTIPYCAGVLAMGWQIRPDLTPSQMEEILFASAHVHESGARIIHPAAFIDLVRKQSDNHSVQASPQTVSETQTIIPGVRVGEFTLGMNKDDVLKKAGEEPEAIYLGEQKYSLNDLPSRYIMAFGDVSFWIENDSVNAISMHSSLYKLSNGLGVGDSEQKIKQAFGNDFHLNDMGNIKDLLTYKDKGLIFEIRETERTVIEIGIYQAANHGDSDAPEQQEKMKHTIVPGVRVGDYTFGMSKDEVLIKLGEPEVIQLGEDEFVHRGEEKYSLNNLPRKYIMSFGNISFLIDDDSVGGIIVRSPLYELSNGLKVGDSEQKIKQALGEDFQLREDEGKEYLLSDAERLAFEIHKKNRTVTEIIVFQPEGDRGDRDAPDQQEQSKGTIVPGVGVGDYTLGMSKDDVLKKLGEPKSIFWGSERYTLDNLPERYFMTYGDISFRIEDNSVTGIGLHRSFYRLTNGLGVGDSEEEIKRAFGSDFELQEYERMDALTYKERGLRFEIDKKSRTIEEVGMFPSEGNRSDNPKPKLNGRDELMAYEDVSGKDLRASDLRYSEDILDTLEFNQKTQWPPPERLPEGFDPQVLLQESMNPGLGVRALHAQGITGAGVHVGLIDQPLLLDHPEYEGKIVSYHSDCGPHKSSMHGPAMASQIVGKRCGTAPGASLHVVAVPSWKADAGYYARALDRFVAYNENAPKEQKIRVVSVSCQPSGEGSVFENQPLWDEAVQRAQDKGILVLDCTWHHGFVSLCWLDPANRESVEACTPGFRLGEVKVDAGHIHVPSAPRTTAEAEEDRSFGYTYDGGGRRSRRPKAKNGYSDTIPYAAGILALGWQVRPDLTPAQIKEMLFASAYVHESGAKIIHPTAFIDLVRGQSSNPVSQGVCKEDSETLTIVPGVGVGDYTLDMSKDDVLSKLGEPETIQFGEDEVIRRGEKKYNLNDLPREYILSFNDVSFWFENDSVQFISVHSPLYKLGNGLGVGDSEQKIKQAFGEDSKLEEAFGKEFCCYHAKGIGFEIHEKNRTVTGIVVYRTEGDSGDPNVPDSAEAALVRKAAADGRIAYKLTTPDEFKAIAGQPTRERTESNGELICMEYPGFQARFFGKPRIQTTHTLVSISCEGKGIDIGQNRQIVLRHEGDLDKLGSFWGFSDVNLSRLDLSQKGDLLKTTTFDSLTVWPPSDRMPPDFDPVKLLEWGKNPGLGIRSLHREGITGKGVGIAIIDQPLLKNHIEYADRIKSYHAIEVEGVDIQMHGSPVCSIAVGKNCGVAPEASLHYYAVPPWKWGENRPWARTVEQIVERNRDLPPSEKVRVISISLGAFWQRDYLETWQAAVKKANRNGILVVTCDPLFLRYVTLERLVGTDPDDPNNYYFDSGVNALYVPASNWSIASHRGKDVYTFDTRGGNSWTVPYLAGLAAMAFQVHPDISPERIVTLFQETATQTKQGRAINPRGFVEAVKRLKPSKR